MGHHSNDDDTYDPKGADSDIRAKVEKWNKPYKVPSKPAEQVYCRGKMANGKHNFSGIDNIGIGKFKHGYVEDGKILGFTRRKKVSYWENTYTCIKCGARYISRTGCEIVKTIPGGQYYKSSSSYPASTFGTGKYDPLPPGVKSYEWLG